MVLHPGIAFDEAAANFFRTVGGGIVRNDDLKIHIGLRERGLRAYSR